MSDLKEHGPYDHTNSCFEKACDISQDEISEKFNPYMKEGIDALKAANPDGVTFSQVIELYETSPLSRRELAFLCASLREQVNEQSNPLAALLAGMGEKRD